jgi:hypothetical protein
MEISPFCVKGGYLFRGLSFSQSFEIFVIQAIRVIVLPIASFLTVLTNVLISIVHRSALVTGFI